MGVEHLTCQFCRVTMHIGWVPDAEVCVIITACYINGWELRHDICEVFNSAIVHSMLCAHPCGLR